MDAVQEHAASEMSAYKQARFQLIAMMPELSSARPGHPFVMMDEAVWSIWCQAWLDGVRAGAAYENLRRGLLGSVTSCQACDGLGLVDASGAQIYAYDAPDGARPCSACKGSGVVATASREGRNVLASIVSFVSGPPE